MKAPKSLPRCACIKVGVLTIAKESEIKICCSTTIDNISKQTEQPHVRKEKRNPTKLENMWASMLGALFFLFFLQNRKGTHATSWSENLVCFTGPGLWDFSFNPHLVPCQGWTVTKWDTDGAAQLGAVCLAVCWRYQNVIWSSILIWKSTADEHSGVNGHHHWCDKSCLFWRVQDNVFLVLNSFFIAVWEHAQSSWQCARIEHKDVEIYLWQLLSQASSLCMLNCWVAKYG